MAEFDPSTAELVEEPNFDASSAKIIEEPVSFANCLSN